MNSRLKIETMGHIDELNALEFIYTEDEEYSFEEAVSNLTGSNPELWEYKDGNRQQCYSSMFSKLLAAFLLKEGREKGYLSEEFMRKISDKELDTFNHFLYDDRGYLTADVLNRIFKEVLVSGGIFDIDVHVPDLDAAEEVDWEEKPSLVKEALSIVPGTSKLEEEDLEILCYYINKVTDSLDLEIEEISSQLLYQIYKAEKKEGQEQKIIKMAGSIMPYIYQTSPPYCFATWVYIDDKEGRIRYFAVTGNKIVGDCSWGGEFVVEQMYRYNYSHIYSVLELKEMINDWKK